MPKQKGPEPAPDKPKRKRSEPVVYVRPTGILINPTLEDLRYTFNMMKKALDFTNVEIALWFGLTQEKSRVSSLFLYHKKKGKGTVPRSILAIVNMWIALGCPINREVIAKPKPFFAKRT